MTDLEQEIYDALHERAEGVTTADLRYVAQPRAQTSRTRVYAPLAAAAAVVALGAAVAVWTAGGSSDPAQPAVGQTGNSLSAVPSGTSQNGTVHGGAILRGTSWRLTSVTSDGRALAIPAALHAGVSFDRGGQIGADDGVNSYFGSYRATSRGIAIGELGGTQVGSTGVNAARSAAIAGIAAVHGTVTTDIEGRTLVIHAHGVTLMFKPTPLDPGFNGASPTPSGLASATSTGTPPVDVPSYINGSEVAAPPTP